jgi:ABC-type antimicrobial peptide transport system permease subunit
VVTVAGNLAVGLINGAVIVETVFGWPGVGKLMIDAVVQRDFAVVQASIMVTAIAIFLMNVLIDLLYAAARPEDPPPVSDPVDSVMNTGRGDGHPLDRGARRKW